MIDKENPEWTDEVFARAVPFSGLPQEMQKVLRRRGERGPGKKPAKQLISLRLSPEVLAFFRSTGRGWQRKIDAVLKAQIKRKKGAA